MKNLYRILMGLFLDSVQGAIQNSLGDRLFAVDHQAVHEFSQHPVAIFGVGQNVAFYRSMSP